MGDHKILKFSMSFHYKYCHVLENGNGQWATHVGDLHLHQDGDPLQKSYLNQKFIYSTAGDGFISEFLFFPARSVYLN